MLRPPWQAFAGKHWRKGGVKPLRVDGILLRSAGELQNLLEHDGKPLNPLSASVVPQTWPCMQY